MKLPPISNLHYARNLPILLNTESRIEARFGYENIKKVHLHFGKDFSMGKIFCQYLNVQLGKAKRYNCLKLVHKSPFQNTLKGDIGKLRDFIPSLLPNFLSLVPKG